MSDNVDVKYDSEKLAKDAQEIIESFRVKMKNVQDECLGKLYSEVVPYFETDTFTNYRESLRIELEHEYKFSNFKQPWATNLRRAIFVENRDEISSLIAIDILKRNKELEDIRGEFEMFRYSKHSDTKKVIKDLLAIVEDSISSLGFTPTSYVDVIKRAKEVI